MKECNLQNIEDDEYEIKCGEIILTKKGNIIFHCSLCDIEFKKFKDFEEYATHIQENHVNLSEFSAKFKVKEETAMDPLAPTEHPEKALRENEFAIAELKSSKHIVGELSGLEVNKTEEPIKLKPTITDSTKDIKRESSPVEVAKSISESDTTMDFGKILESVDLQIKKKRYKREDRKYKCPHCDFAAKDSTNLAYHVRRHSSFKPHKCTECERGFYTKSELNTHRRTHTGERPFLCTDCGRAFMTSGMLSDHVKRHKNLREKECAVCGMKFYSAKQLRAHIVVHSDDRLHKCPECNKGFKQRVALKNHMKLHANKREYQCEFCSSTFNQSSGLYSHIKNKHTSVSPVPDFQNQPPESAQELNKLDSSLYLQGRTNGIDS